MNRAVATGTVELVKVLSKLVGTGWARLPPPVQHALVGQIVLAVRAGGEVLLRRWAKAAGGDRTSASTAHAGDEQAVARLLLAPDFQEVLTNRLGPQRAGETTDEFAARAVATLSALITESRPAPLDPSAHGRQGPG